MIRKFLQQTPRLFDLAKQAGRACGHRTPLNAFLHGLLPSDVPVSFLQAGANDGLTNDPYREFILRSNFRGVLVEPAPYAQRKLQANYRHKAGLHFAGCLITYPPADGVEFFTFAEDFLKGRSDAAHLSMVSSLSREQLAGELAQDVDLRSHIITTRVSGRTIEQLMASHGFRSFDCLFIDVEGYEPRILLGLDYAVVRPKLIAFESLHLGTARTEVRAHLVQQGFRLFDFDQEMIAVSEWWLERIKS